MRNVTISVRFDAWHSNIYGGKTVPVACCNVVRENIISHGLLPCYHLLRLLVGKSSAFIAVLIYAPLLLML